MQQLPLTWGGDICPAGWHLPSSTSSGEFAALSVALGGLNDKMDEETNPTGRVASEYFRAYPNNFLYSGFWEFSSSVRMKSYHGSYWSRTANSNSFARGLDFDWVNVKVNYAHDDKNGGNSVRCVADYTVNQQ